MGELRKWGCADQQACDPNVLQREINEPKVQGEKEKGRKRKEGVTLC